MITITLCSFERAGLCDDDAVASGFSKSFAKVWHGVAIRPSRQPYAALQTQEGRGTVARCGGTPLPRLVWAALL